MHCINFRLLAVVAVVVSIAAPVAATAQDPASAAAVSAASMTKAQQKAQRKAARKEARAKKNAELKKLEDAGYNPGAGNDNNYPQDIQNAEKKVAHPSAASQ